MMKNMRNKFALALILIVSMSVALVACGRKTSSEVVQNADGGNTQVNQDNTSQDKERLGNDPTSSDPTAEETEAENHEESDETDTETEVQADGSADSASNDQQVASTSGGEDSDDQGDESDGEDGGDTSSDDGVITICIDPGHGGDSLGTKEEYDGELICEKNLNYRIATSLKSYLEEYGVNVVLTHSLNSDLSLAGRINYAVANDADYFISVHVNSRSQDEVNSSGCMVLMSCSSYQPGNAKVNLYDTERAMATSILSRLHGLGLQNANDFNTENTGGILQRVNTEDEYYPDGSPADFYGLLYHGTYAGIPSIIVEHAFLSNESDYYNYLNTNAKLDALARADAEGLADALGLR